jgi:2-hydroxychromene-2-carboxylate isomerase
MGDVTDLAAFRRASRRQAGATAVPAKAEFHFDLASPLTYLAADRVQRTFTQLTWIPAFAHVIRPGTPDLARERAAADARAVALRLPLVWPERWPHGVPAAMRATSYAATKGRAAEFVVAACRLAWAGGFDLEDPQVLAEAAAAANVSPEESLRAARDARRDAEIEAASHRIAAAGADRLPACVVRRAVFVGEERIAEAAAYARSVAATGA